MNTTDQAHKITIARGPKHGRKYSWPKDGQHGLKQVFSDVAAVVYPAGAQYIDAYNVRADLLSKGHATYAGIEFTAEYVAPAAA